MRLSIFRTTSLAAALSLLVGTTALAAPTIVAASDVPSSYVLDVYYCVAYNADTGDIVDPGTLAPGVEILMFTGWAAKTRGEVEGFVNNVTWGLTINGQATDVTPYLSGLLPAGPDLWEDFFFYPAGALGSGQSFHTHYDPVLKSAAFDGFTLYKKGSVFNGGVGCAVTAA